MPKQENKILIEKAIKNLIKQEEYKGISIADILVERPDEK